MISRLVFRLYPHFAIIDDITLRWILSSVDFGKWLAGNGYPMLGKYIAK
jgi:hypothetical protein